MTLGKQQRKFDRRMKDSDATHAYMRLHTACMHNAVTLITRDRLSKTMSQALSKNKRTFYFAHTKNMAKPFIIVHR